MDCTRSGSLLDREKQRRGILSFRSSKRLQFSAAVDDPKKPSSPPTSRSVDSKLLWPCRNPNQKPVGDLLPERLQLLEEFYSAMEASISLLNIRRATCSFSAVAMAVESSTQRRFLRKHLAQIKYIQGEAVKVEEFKSWNSDTQSYFKDLRITLLPMSIQGRNQAAEGNGKANSKPATQMVTRMKEFHRRLVEFFRSRLQDDVEVPEADLLAITPACFSPLQEDDDHHDDDQTILSHTAFDPSKLKKFPRSPLKAFSLRQSPPPPLSHFSGSFKKHFSSKKPHPPTEASHITDSEAFMESQAPSSHFPSDITVSEKACSHAIDSLTVPSTPQKPSSSFAPLAQDLMMSPPNRKLISASKFDNQTPCSILSNPFASPISSTPYQEVSTPLRAAAAALPCPAEPVSKAPQEVPGKKKQRQAVIKSLRFGGTPKKETSEDHDLGQKDETDAHISNNSDAKMLRSPMIRSRAGLAKSKQRISKALPFNSPKRRYSEVEEEWKFNQEDSVSKQTVQSDKVTQMLVFDSPKRCTVSSKRLKISAEDTFHDKQGMDACSSVQEKQRMHDPVSAADYNMTAADMDMLQCLPKKLLDDVQAKERKLMEDNERGVEEERRRKCMIAGLPKLFNSVRLIFQSANRTVFTSKELTRLVLSSQPNITDQDEIVEQLQLLVDLAPQWISANLSSTGEHVYRISKGADMKKIAKNLSQAV